MFRLSSLVFLLPAAFLVACSQTPVEPLEGENPADPPPLEGPEQEPEEGEPVLFPEDPLAVDPLAVDPVDGDPLAVDQEGANTLYYPEDPFADPNAEIMGPGSELTYESLWERDPERILVELEAPPEVPTPDEGFIRRGSEMALARLKARALTEELSRTAKVSIPKGPHTMGAILPVRFEVQNPYGDRVELLPSVEGLILELDWTVERWLAVTGHDRVIRHRYFKVGQWFVLDGGQTFVEFADLPLILEGDPGAVWVVTVDARIRCAGATLDEEVLPVHQIDFRASREVVLPKGWQQFQEDPYGELERLVTSPAEEVDRNLLVCAALLNRTQAYRAVDMLLDRLEEAPHARRRLSMTQVLQWLTDLDIGSRPEDWLRWREARKMAAASESP